MSGRVQCPEGTWFSGDRCPRCEWPVPDPEPLPPARREVEEQVTKVDREALRVMPDDRVFAITTDARGRQRRRCKVCRRVNP